MSLLRVTKAARYGPLRSAVQAKIATEIPRIKKLREVAGEEMLSKATVNAAYQGSRGVTTMVYEPSLLDSEEGIRFRGLSIPECQEQLTKFPGGKQMQPEAMFWLLLTGNVPTEQETRGLTADLASRATSPAAKKALEETFAVLDACPKDLHPMSQLIIASSTLQKHSQFVSRYNSGMKKSEYWEVALEDSLDLVARLSPAAARIYNNVYNNGAGDYTHDNNLDWTGNFVKHLGMESDLSKSGLSECMRLYMSIHVDHEGGNVSAHATQLVGSALSDPYLSFAGGMTGLAGPLHGLANQEVLGFMQHMLTTLESSGTDVAGATRDELVAATTKFAWDTLNSGRVIPGFGHAVLRKTDPRYTCQREFALGEDMSSFPLFRLTDVCYEVLPKVLTEHGKTKNPWPNVDAHSGCLLQYYGVKEENFYTVLFGVSRALGVLSALVWNRALGVPIERPKSVTSESLYKKFNIE